MGDVPPVLIPLLVSYLIKGVLKYVVPLPADAAEI